MILVTVGTHNVGFERLVRAMDALAADLEEEVIIQYGSSAYLPHHARAVQWTTGEEMVALARKARVIVTHSAAGSILMGLKECRPLVVVPRQKEHGEVVDNHQIQLARALAAGGRAVMVTEPDPGCLRAAIEQAAQQPRTDPGSAALVGALRSRLVAWNQ